MNYTKEDKLAWQRQRIAEHVAKGQLKATPQIKAFIVGKPMPPGAQVKPLSLGAKVSVNTEAKTGKGEVHRTITANQGSTCFDSLVWEDGLVTAVFAKDDSVYEYEMDRDDFLEWARSGSLGEFFNAEVR